jgi:O-antigen ligase
VSSGSRPTVPAPIPAPPITPLDDVRAAARRQARALSGGLMAGIATGAALLIVLLFLALDYRFNQYPHRLVKILAGAVVMGGIVIQPIFGLLALPVLTPFFPVLPVSPIPALNPVNVLLVTVFAAWGMTCLARRQPLFLGGRLAVPIGLLVVLAGLSILRGAAFPTGARYEPVWALHLLFRSAVVFVGYFIGLSMIRGPEVRRRLTWALVIGLLLEAVATIAWGQNGRGGRAVGSFDQPNELGAFLSMFTVFCAALLMGVRGWMARLILLAAVVAGTQATFMTLSRGAMVALAAGLVVVALRSSRVLSAVVALALVTSPLWAPASVKERLMSTQVEVEGTDEVAFEGSTQARLETWRAGLDIVARHPLDGVGFGGLIFVLPETGERLGFEEVQDTPHNTFLRMIGELGILGLALFCWLLWRCWRLSLDGVRAAAHRFERQLAVALGGATVALAANCWFGDRFFSILITGNFWLACAAVDDLVARRRVRAAPAAASPRHQGQQ